MCLLDFDVRC